MLRTKYIVVGRRASCGRAVGEEEGWWKNYRALRESQRIMSVIWFGSSLDQALLCSNRVTKTKTLARFETNLCLRKPYVNGR